MNSFRHFAAAAIACVAFTGAAQTSSPVEANPQQQMAERRRFAQEMLKMRRVINANDDISTPGAEFKPGATSPDYFEMSAVPMLKQAKISDDQIKRMTKVNRELWELRTHDQDATSPEVSRQVKALLKEEESILTPEQHDTVMDIVKKHAIEMRGQARSIK